MPGAIHGVGRKRRDDVLNRVMDTIYKGQPIPLGGNYDPAVMQALSSAASQATVVEIDLVNRDTGMHLAICNISKEGGPDVCG